jgi:putative membrane protein
VSELRPDPASGPLDLDDGWRRLHPLTPLVRGWKVLAVVLAIIAQLQGQVVFREGLPSQRTALFALGGLSVVGVVVGLYTLIAWRCARYQVDEHTLRLHQGVVFRQQRQARLDRLQAVDVVRPLLGRFFGLAELKVEVAGGKDSGINLAFLREEDATELRNTLLARAAGVHYEGERAPVAPEHEVLSVPVGRVVASIATSPSAIFAALAFAVCVSIAVATERLAVFVVMAGLLIGLAGTLWQQFTAAFGFRVATSPDGVRLHHGLLTSRSQTVPPGRVQAIRVRQSLFWRPLDWWALEVNVAGYGGSSGAGTSGRQYAEQENVLLTVGSREQALAVLRLALPALDPHDVGSATALAIAAGLTGVGDDGGYLPAPRSARWLDPIAWRRNGVNVQDEVLLIRRGVLTRSLDVVPHARTQSLGVRQGPLQRKLGLASFHVHSTSGPVTPVVQHLATALTAELLDGPARRAREARSRAGGPGQGRWLAR